MPAVTRVSLTCPGPFHFGRRGVGLNETEVTLPADALFSALCVVLGQIAGHVEVEALQALYPTHTAAATAPPLRLTSLMPSAAGVDLLPMPMLRPRLPGDRLSNRKSIKKIKWLSRGIFNALCAGADMKDSLTGGVYLDGDRPYTVQDGAVWVTKGEQEKLGGSDAVLWRTAQRPRVTVDRITSASTVYSSGAVRFAEHVTLYAYARWDAGAPSALREQIKDAWTALGEAGLGGERSVGYGAFEATMTDEDVELGAPGGEYWTTLSPYIPRAAEAGLVRNAAAYRIILRRGWLSIAGYTNLRRPTVRMLDTGAVLPQFAADSETKRVEPTGCLMDATPAAAAGVDVRRYGIAWPVPVSAQAVQEGREDHE